jgi:predicted dehydrogenase
MRAMLRDRPGNVVVFTGRNRGKIDRILATLSAGLNVFADKPWIITPAQMQKLEESLALAERKNLAAYDIMTERYEPVTALQRIFVNDAAVFGRLETGSASHPAIRVKSIHHIMKVVAGVPLRRPGWFFDTTEYGEALADVGTHAVDLVQWTAFPDQAIDYRTQIRMLAAKHWPVPISREQFRQVTGENEFPRELAAHVRAGKFDFFCNNAVEYTLRGLHVRMEILWNWEAPPGAGDIYEAAFRGTRARAEIRQGQAEKWTPELYIVPADGDMSAVRKKVAALQDEWPGLALEEKGTEARIVIPEKFRVGHEAHFAQVANRFFEYLKSPKSVPAWERPNMLAKYYVSTMGVEMAQ